MEIQVKQYHINFIGNKNRGEKMNKIGIITINDNNNYGNRLQNYAVQTYLKKLGFDVETLKNKEPYNEKKKYVFRVIKNVIKGNKRIKDERLKRFEDFNKNIKFSKRTITAFSNIKDKYDFFVVGSDQVWNSNIGRLRDVDLLGFARDKQKIAFSASFGVSEISSKDKEKVEKEISKFKAISVREKVGENIIKKLTNRTDVEVLIDPTMLLNPEEWDIVAKRPKQIDLLKNKKYILNYFLGELSENRKKEIERVAKENNCDIINILDKKSPFYQTGPSEFLYLEKNAFLICTDSFHSSVFAILYNNPFIVFSREGNGCEMNSRIETLLNKFKLENRMFNDNKIDIENLQLDYNNSYKILEKERIKSKKYLMKALNI
mgnify:FL=1